MASAPYQHHYQRARPATRAPAAGYLPNPACQWTDQGGDPDPADLGWCIRRHWRVIYYSARHAAGLPLWDGVDDFEVLMTDVLWRLSSAFSPIGPLGSAELAAAEEPSSDVRKQRVYQPSYRIFRAPVFDGRKGLD